MLQSSLLSSVHIWKRPQKRVLCHSKVPNETQASQDLKSMIKRKPKTKILRLLYLFGRSQHINITRIHLHFVCRYSRYWTKHVHTKRWMESPGEQKNSTEISYSKRWFWTYEILKIHHKRCTFRVSRDTVWRFSPLLFNVNVDLKLSTVFLNSSHDMKGNCAFTWKTTTPPPPKLHPKHIPSFTKLL